MIEEVILNYLRENAFSCYMSMPEKPSGNFCVLEKTGSSYEDGIFTATLAVHLCSSTAQPFCGTGHAGCRCPARNFRM